MTTRRQPAGPAALLALLLASCGDGGEPGEAQAPLAGASDQTQLEFYLPQERTRRIFDIDWSAHRYDPFTYFTKPANASYRYPWPEHASGELHIRSNALGTRDDEDLRDPPPDLRIVVTGDSHTDGVCLNAESYANRLEARLAEADAGRSVEVLNAGVGGFSFYNYLGTLHKFLAVDPDVFVVGVYGGNDFLETLRPVYGFQGAPIPAGGPEYWARINGAKDELGREALMAVNQDFNQRYYFQHFPEQLQPMLDAAVARMRDVAEVCRERGVALVVLYIPPPHDVQPERFDGLFEDLAAQLELEPAALESTQRLAQRLLDALRADGIDVVDGREVLLHHAADEMLFWRRDHHINVAAHDRLAEALVPTVEALVGGE